MGDFINVMQEIAGAFPPGYDTSLSRARARIRAASSVGLYNCGFGIDELDQDAVIWLRSQGFKVLKVKLHLGAPYVEVSWEKKTNG